MYTCVPNASCSLKKDICLVLNFAPKYRKGIFQLIDNTFDCDWIFGTPKTDITRLDISLLNRATEVSSIKLIGNWYWQKSVLSLLAKHDTFFISGELYCLSTWVFALLAKFYPKKKVYFWSHGWYGRESLAKKILKKIYFRLPKGTFLYGNHARNLMIKEGFDGSKLYVIHNSLNYEAHIKIRNEIRPSNIYTNHFGNNNKTLVFIGRLTEAKRLDLLISAVSKLLNEGKQFNIVLVGDGEMKESLQKQSEEVGINIWFYGACYDERTNAELIYNADLCISPGNVGLTAIHSMVFGTPVITHDNFPYQGPEFETIKPGKTGDFFTRGDIDSLVQAINRWFSSHNNDRDVVRQQCFDEIDNYWTPEYQLNVVKSVIG